jgi:6-phosphogluconolactonase (cycloisomerase 2 family)/uncharacterized protein YceK
VRRSLFVKLIAPLACQMLLSGCGSFFSNQSTTTTYGTSSSNDYLFVGNSSSGSGGTLAGYAMNSGTITETAGSPITLTYIPNVMHVRPGDDWLYVGSATTGGIYGFSIASTGVLTASNSGVSLTADSPIAMDIDSTGTYLVVLENDYTTLTVYSINKTTGNLALASQALATAGGTGAAVRFLPNDKFVYVATGTGGVSIFSFSAGTLTNTGYVLSGSSLSSYNDLCADSTSSHLVLAQSGTNAGVRVYTIQATGALTAGTSYSAGTAPYALDCDATYSTVYSADKTGNEIFEFSLSGGTLTEIGTISEGITPFALAVDNSGDTLLSLNLGGSPDLEDYSFSTSGVLSADQSLATTGTTPIAMAATH